MQYLGGKSRIAKRLVQTIGQHVPTDCVVWEPFCGGGAVTAAFGQAGYEVLASDTHVALIAMWQAVQTGWLPPEVVTRADFDAARHLPDTAPMKAALGFGCSFGGKYFDTFDATVDKYRPVTRGPKSGQLIRETPAAHRLAVSLRRARAYLGRVQFRVLDFFAVAPSKTFASCIYADPPYNNTTGYGTVFDSERFWQRCSEWASQGVAVFVSEFTCPISHEVIWELERVVHLSADKASTTNRRREVLYRVML